jgi:hypothetical protein
VKADLLRSRRVGLALSGGSVRGLAHIGVIKALTEAGIHPLHPRGLRAYPAHYRRAIRHTDVLVTPSIPAAGYVPGARAVERMITAGACAAWRELKRLGVGAV